MESVTRIAKLLAATIAAVFVGLHIMIQLLVYAIGFDILTGLMAAWITKSIDSSVSRRGVGRKVMMLLGVAAAEIAGHHIGLEVSLPWGGTWGLGAAVAGYYCIHEALSITENLARAGVPLPQWMTARLQQLESAASESSIQHQNPDPANHA